MSDQAPPPDQVLPAPDPAAASAAADPLPGARKRGRPKGSKNSNGWTPERRAKMSAFMKEREAAKREGRAPRTTTAKAGPTDAQLKAAVAGVYAMAGTGVAFVDQEFGLTLAAVGEAAAEAWMHLAQQNPAVRRALVKMTTASAASELLMAHAPLLMLGVARVQARRAAAPVGDAPLADAPANGAGPPVSGLFR